MVSNMLKMHKTEKASLRGYGVSNGIDNISLSKWGVEKFVNSPSASGKVTGGAFTLAGLSLLSGQAGIDRDWGRGLMWNGIGIILAGMGLEAGGRVLASLKNKSVNPVLVREWKVLAENTVLNKKLVKEIESKIAEAIPENSNYNLNSEEIAKIIKSKLSEIKDLKDFQVLNISDTKEISKIINNIEEQERKLIS
jgi:hypothetical protein